MTQCVKIERRAMLGKIMDSLGSRAEPVFSVIECDDGSVKVSIKLDVSNLTTPTGERIDHSFIQSEAF